MTDDTQQIVLVTGAGSGIGRAIAVALARAGHRVYASMPDPRRRNRERSDALQQLAQRDALPLHVLELDVLSETGCRVAVDRMLARHGRLDVVVNNAGMLMTGVTEAFSIEQVARIVDTNALSWLHEPFLGPYVASKAAGDALAEVMAMEVRPAGIDSVILVPGAFTSGTEHFADAHPPEYLAIEQQYGDLPMRIATLGDRLDAIDRAHGGALDVSAVGQAAIDVVAMPRGERPFRVIVDGQRKGTDAIDALYREKQVAFLRQIGLDDLALPRSRVAVG